jgi:hypothetical protein
MGIDQPWQQGTVTGIDGSGGGVARHDVCRGANDGYSTTLHADGTISYITNPVALHREQMGMSKKSI